MIYELGILVILGNILKETDDKLNNLMNSTIAGFFTEYTQQ